MAAEYPDSQGLGLQDENLVSAEELLNLLWSRSSRPSIRWLRAQQAKKTIPYVKLGGRVWFCPRDVRLTLKKRWTVGRSNPQSVIADLHKSRKRP